MCWKLRFFHGCFFEFVVLNSKSHWLETVFVHGRFFEFFVQDKIQRNTCWKLSLFMDVSLNFWSKIQRTICWKLRFFMDVSLNFCPRQNSKKHGLETAFVHGCFFEFLV